ncbi:MAG: hypothetical protein IPO00_06870 [Betaproteobacteria bacterium]|nr:hypothetical protein [Betaproteobacteria bacterium]
MQLLITPKLSERRTAVIMLVLTVLYLLVEVGFNARLLDTVGGLASPDEIDSIEKYGRVISGVALTLFAWGHLIKKDLAAPKSHSLSLKLGMALVVCCTLMYFVQEAIITGLVAASSNDTRARAVLLVPLTNILPRSR